MPTSTDLCNYEGIDSTATVGTRMDDSGQPVAFSRCHCGIETYVGASPDEAAQALIDHRAQA